MVQPRVDENLPKSQHPRRRPQKADGPRKSQPKDGQRRTARRRDPTDLESGGRRTDAPAGHWTSSESPRVVQVRLPSDRLCPSM